MRLPVALAALSIAAAPAAAQQPATTAMTPRAVSLEDIERSRGNVLKYLDAAPDSMLGYRPSAGVRSFAEQIEHAAGTNVFIVTQAWEGKPSLVRTDSAVYLHDKAQLRDYVSRSYDRFARAVRDASDEQLRADVTFFGRTKSGWRWVDTALEHATWTLGQTVPYLRANQVKPPAYLPF